MAGRKRDYGHVAILRPADRPIVLRYIDPITRKKIRRSTGTRDIKKARALAKQLEAELRTGTHLAANERTWEEFRERYHQDELMVNFRPQSQATSNSVLDLFEKIVNPLLLVDAVTTEAMLKFRNALAAGKFSRTGRRSKHTVVSRMATLVAAFNWAETMGYVQSVPKLPRFRAPDIKGEMKGRPITDDEFAALLNAVPRITGESTASGWRYLLRGIVESGFRLGEAMRFSWDLPKTITPSWAGVHPTIRIPGELQKNGKAEQIAMLPGFEALLLETPEECRTGWVFEPMSVKGRWSRAIPDRRMNSEWVGRIISRIGEAAGIIVDTSGDKPKYCSAHDLRRTCADRLEAAGVDPRIISRVLRHKSYETTRKFYAKGDVARDGANLRLVLISGHIAGHTSAVEST